MTAKTPATFEEAVRAASDLLREPRVKPTDPTVDTNIALHLLEEDFALLEEWFLGKRDEDYLPVDLKVFANTATWAYVNATGQTLQNVRRVVIAKQQDYGHGNILRFGMRGIVIRVSDKLARLRNLLTQNREATNESVADTWLDIVGYSLIALMLVHGTFELPLTADKAQTYAPSKPEPDIAGRDIGGYRSAADEPVVGIVPNDLIIGHLPVAGWGT